MRRVHATRRQQPQPRVGGVGNFPVDAQIQVRTRRHAFRGGPPKRNDQRVRLMRCGDEQAAVGREHSCPACSFECDRDANAAANILSRGLDQVGVVHPGSMPSETATAVGTNVSAVPARRVMEQGSPAFNERVSANRAG